MPIYIVPKEGTLSAKELRKGFFSIVFYIVLIVITTRIAFSFHDEYYQHLYHAIRSLLVEEFNPPLYSQIVTKTDWWVYLERLVGTNLCSECYEMDEYNQTGFRDFFVENVMIGNPNLRQIRVAEDSCDVHAIFSQYYNNCYAIYDPKYEDKNATFKGTPYMTYEEYPAEPMKGVMAKYIGPGYVQKLTPNAETNLKIIQKLRADNWIDRGTRFVVLELVFFNFNLNTFAMVQFCGENFATGHLHPMCVIKLLPVIPPWNDKRFFVYIEGVLFYIIVIYTLSNTIQNLIEQGLFAYIYKGWNLIIVAYVIAAHALIFFLYKHEDGINQLLGELNEQVEVVFLDKWIFFYNSSKITVLVCSVLAWVNIFQFIGFNTTMLNFSIALHKGYLEILGFSFMFMVVFFAFAAVGLLFFGKRNRRFSTFSEALVTMLRMIMNDFQYDELEKADDWLGPIFFLSFIFFVFFILLNTFLAVIGDSYITTRKKNVVGLSVVKGYLKYEYDHISAWLKKRSEKHRRKELSVSFAKTSWDSGGESKSAPTPYQNIVDMLGERRKEVDRLTVTVNELEIEAKLIMQKMDQFLQKLEAMGNK